MRVTLADLGPLVERGVRGVAEEFAEACDAAFDDPVWGWTGTTRRQNGETVGSPRNIVDTGTLRDSRQPVEMAGASARLTWAADHAAATFLGAVFKDRAASLPARNLPRYVAQDFNFAEVFLRRSGLR
ncbi:hypothetical protein [Deinococcus sp. Leaf326]|uniref:hypothetical protein n=1 Tax=Deinococcus sp. Leaf326 TaxID=1736338 RepID=UPI0012E29875|nr:hypothetical protein [Deinococcus sp. Leaf326]